jgi:hypothetical protein
MPLSSGANTQTQGSQPTQVHAHCMDHVGVAQFSVQFIQTWCGQGHCDVTRQRSVWLQYDQSIPHDLLGREWMT